MREATPKQIATEASRLRGAERTRYLERACAGDGGLRDTVERLLSMHESVTVDAPDRGTNGGSVPGTLRFEEFTKGRGAGMPDRVGAYRILDELGVGAMGRVYLAEQRQPKRRVALKVVRPEALTPERERRFDLEAESLARLRHPGIATIFEAGRADLHGRPHPFFAMELVQGDLLDDHCRGLETRARLGLMASVCDAVEHAHRRGILHRDLKPANIIVDEDGRAKVLDFGVARTLESEGRVGELVGTVPYMSPEQLSCDPDVDARTDVFALGVILHEVLTGRRPFDTNGMTVDEALDVVSVPATLSASDLGRDLAAIVARAIEPDRERRYASAGELAGDLRRFLRGEPVLAVGGGAWYRARKFVGRNRGLVALAGLAGVLLVGGVAGVAWQATRATRGWRQAELETARAEEALGTAEAQRRKAVAVNTFMTNMLTSADPEIALGNELTVRELLDNSAGTVGFELADQPDIEATVRMALTNTYIALGRFDSAETQASAMLALCREKLGPADPMTADAERTLAQVYAETGRYDQAEELVRGAIPVIDGLGDKVESARVRGELARVLHGAGRHEESFALWTQAEKDLAEAVGPNDKNTMVMVHNRGMALKDLGRLAEAELVMRDLVRRRTEAFGPEHPQTLAAEDILAGVIQKQGRDAEAAAMLREVVAGRRRVLGEDHIATLLSMGNLGVTLVRLGEAEEAEELTRSALEAHRRVFGPDHAKTLILQANLAYILEDRGQRDEAAEMYRGLIEARKRSTGGRDPETWAPMNNLAMLYQDMGRYGDARALYEELLAMCDEMLPPGHYYTAIFRNNYGSCLTELGEYDRAREALRVSHAVIASVFGPDHERTKKSAARMADLEERERQSRGEPGGG